MDIHFELMEDKIEFFEADELKILEKKIAEQIELNKTLLLSVHSVSHQMHVSEKGKTYFSAVVHFKQKK